MRYCPAARLVLTICVTQPEVNGPMQLQIKYCPNAINLGPALIPYLAAVMKNGPEGLAFRAKSHGAVTYSEMPRIAGSESIVMSAIAAASSITFLWRPMNVAPVIKSIGNENASLSAPVCRCRLSNSLSIHGAKKRNPDAIDNSFSAGRVIDSTMTQYVNLLRTTR
jgi:hypothetical protein